MIGKVEILEEEKKGHICQCDVGERGRSRPAAGYKRNSDRVTDAETRRDVDVEGGITVAHGEGGLGGFFG